MILSVGLRTDIIQHYSDWLFERFREGFLYARNPLFTGRVSSYVLEPDKIDAVVFRSKDYTPALPRIQEISDRFRTYFQVSVTAYETDIEPKIIAVPKRVAMLKELSNTVGKQKTAWRYDNILLTRKYSVEYHLNAFERLASQIAPHVSRCNLHFADPNVALSCSVKNLVRMTADDRKALLNGFARIAAQYGLTVTTCGSGEIESDVQTSGCLTLGILAEANGCTFKEMQHKGNKSGCYCIVCRDVGWYDTCPSRCKHCVRNQNEKLLKEQIGKHDSHSPLLIGRLAPHEKLITGVQDSYLRADANQITLFDL